MSMEQAQRPHPSVTAAHARRLAEARERLAAVIAAGDRASIRRVREIVERLEKGEVR